MAAYRVKAQQAGEQRKSKGAQRRAHEVGGDDLAVAQATCRLEYRDDLLGREMVEKCGQYHQVKGTVSEGRPQCVALYDGNLGVIAACCLRVLGNQGAAVERADLDGTSLAPGEVCQCPGEICPATGEVEDA